VKDPAEPAGETFGPLRFTGSPIYNPGSVMDPPRAVQNVTASDAVCLEISQRHDPSRYLIPFLIAYYDHRTLGNTLKSLKK
jgi:hypothetical protein